MIATETRALDDLKPYGNNARTHPEAQIDALAKMITEFGFTVPCVVNKKGVLIAGHGRVEAARKAGLTEVPVIVVSKWTKKQEAAYRIAENRVAEMSG